jgi:HEPN domain-containing protein
MRLDHRTEGLRWLRQAEHDLSDAEFLYARGAEQVLGHWVADLISECGNLDSEFRALKPKAAPAEAFDESDARRALEVAGDVVRVVKEKLAGDP